MYNGISRNSKLFSPELCDELNSSFSKTLSKIENFHPKELDPQYTSSGVGIDKLSVDVDITSSSFSLGNEHWLNIVVSVKNDIEDEDIANLSGFPDTDTVFVQFVKKNSVSGKVAGTFSNGVLHVKGKLVSNTEYLVSTYFVS